MHAKEPFPFDQAACFAKLHAESPETRIARYREDWKNQLTFASSLGKRLPKDALVDLAADRAVGLREGFLRLAQLLVSLRA